MIKKVFFGLAITGAIFFSLMVHGQQASAAVDIYGQACSGAGSSNSQICKKRNTNSIDPFIKDIVNILLYVGGVVCVVMIIMSGIKYTTSAGESGKVSSAKNTLVAAIVGLVIIVMAWAFVNWIVQFFWK